MLQTTFQPLNRVEGKAVQYTAVAARYREQWIFCRLRERESLDIPGGGRMPGEDLEQAARRLLCQFTGAKGFFLDPVAVCRITDPEAAPAQSVRYVMLYFAEITALDAASASNVDEILLWDDFPPLLTLSQAVRPMLEYVRANVCLIRRAAESDSPAICRINRESLGYDYPLEKTRENLARLLEQGGDRIFVAELGEQVVGYIHASRYDCTYADPVKNILALAVDSQYRRSGIGAKLLRTVEHWARQDGAPGIRAFSASVRAGATQFYQKNGYRSRRDQKAFMKTFI